jgi:UDP-glucose 4-epimerase
MVIGSSVFSGRHFIVQLLEAKYPVIELDKAKGYDSRVY